MVAIRGRGLILFIPKAANVPMNVAIKAAVIPTIKE
jgi:hypothetical protein